MHSPCQDSFLSILSVSSVDNRQCLYVIYHVFVYFSTYYLYFRVFFVIYAQILLFTALKRHISFQYLVILQISPIFILYFYTTKKEKSPLPHVYFSFSLSSLHMIFKFVLKFFQTHSGLLFFYDTRKSSENFVSFSVFPCSFRSLRIVRI